MSDSKLHELASPILLKGNDRIGYRDPTAVYDEGVFHLFFTLVETEEDGQIYMYTACSRSSDLLHWSAPQKLTSRDQHLNYSSPGNVVRFGGRWVMCLQTYPRENGEQYGNANSRIWTMESDDLIHWDSPKLLQVKGTDVPLEAMGRMIDPYLIESEEEPGLWYCFYKQNGVSLSYSRDLKHWTYAGHRDAGENVCILRHADSYWMFHSPENGIGILQSEDLVTWREREERFTFDQKQWTWAKGRLTAGFVLDACHSEVAGKYLMFFHGTGPEPEPLVFDTHACIGIAWSDDLLSWDWPQCEVNRM